jgi:di/tricarboxylate transporter
LSKVGENVGRFLLLLTVAAVALSSFLTPLEPATLLVYGLGKFKFADFPKVGLLQTIFILLLSMNLVPTFWPL